MKGIDETSKIEAAASAEGSKRRISKSLKAKNDFSDHDANL